MSLKLVFPLYKLFAKRGSHSSEMSKSLSLLEEQEDKYRSFMGSVPFMGHIPFLKLGLHFLEMFLNSDDDVLDLHIEDELHDVRLELQLLSKRSIKGSQIPELGRVYSNLKEKMKYLLIKQNFERRLVIIEGKFRRKEFILMISRYFLSYQADLIVLLREEIEKIKEKLIPLQALLTYLARKEVYFPDENIEFLTPLSSLVLKAACLIYFCLVEKRNEEATFELKQEFFDLVDKTNVKEIYMVVLRASKSTESTSVHYLLHNLIKLLYCNAKSAICLNDPHKDLFEKLNFLENFIENLPHELRQERFDFHFTAIEAIIWKIVPILCSCYDSHMKEDMTREVNIAVSELADKIKQIEEDSIQVKLYNYPKIDGVGFLDLFLGHLEELLNCDLDSMEVLKNQVERLHVEFKFLRSLMTKIKGQHNKHEELGDLWTRFIGLAYHAEYVIDFHLVKNALDSRIMMSLSNIIEQTKLIKTEVTTIYTKKKYHTQGHDVAKNTIQVSSRATNIAVDEIVGFENEAKKIKEYLFEDQKKLDVISIVGMPGLGKTTLTKKVYEDPSVRECFYVQAWCTVSQIFQKRQLLLTILSDVLGVSEDFNKLNDKELVEKLSLPIETKEVNNEDLAKKLYQSLKGQRYLIIIDDIWDIKAWDYLKRSFPDDKLHSRIIITSRDQKLGSQIEDGTKVHTLNQFSEYDSWILFNKKLCQIESFSSKLMDVGQQIVKSCKGVPLTIVVMAGVLAKVEKSIHKWNEIARELSSHIFSDSESHCRATIELSYNRLPDHLKSCFLYFVAFPEDEEIAVSKLKMLWIAEGFVQYVEEKKLEDVAEEYFLDLINRSLVIPTKENSHGGVKTCRIHDLLHDFCLRKAKEMSFLRVISPHWSEIAKVYEERRLVIDFKEFGPWKAKLSHNNIRSLLSNGSDFSYSSSNNSFIIQNFKLLRVLDLANIYISMSEDGIGLLIHLRYLALKTRSITSSIAKFRYLQSLLVEIGSREDVHSSLWDMVSLHHIRINHRGSFTISTRGLEKSSLLNNVQSLSTPEFFSKADVENILRRVPNLLKLRCEFFNCFEYSFSNMNFRFADLSFLDQLVSLKLFIGGARQWKENCEFKFPRNLQKLSLSGILPKWEDIAEFARNVKVLKLNGEDCDKEWIVNEEDFPILEYLKLSGLSILKWIGSEDSFPKLKQLVMSHCWDLDEIPPCFGEHYTLQVIRITRCSNSVKDSARKIQKVQQEELGNEEFRVYII